MLIEIVADLTCPWCYIGKRRLERALAARPGLDARISWQAFRLNPEMPMDGIARQTFLAAKFGGGGHVRRVLAAIAEAGENEGLAFRFDRIDRIPNTLNAHRLVRFAARHGLQDEMVEALFQAHFYEGLDLGRISVLAGIAGAVGLRPTAASHFLSGENDIDAVLAEDRHARRLGINGVPCFIIDGKYALSGAQEPEFFLPLFDLAGQERETVPASF